MATNPSAIANCLPQLIAAEQRLSQLAASQGIRYAIADFGGFRTPSDTTKILGYRTADYKKYVASLPKGVTPMPIGKWRPIAPYSQSFHDYGAAFDIRITTHPTTLSLAQSLNLVGSYASQAGLRWGASFGDDPHFELPIPLGTAKSYWQDRGNTSGAAIPPGTIVSVLAVLGLLLLGLRRWIT